MQTTKIGATPTRAAVLFMMITAFLSTMGFGIINPVLPFLVQQYLPDQDNVATIIGWLDLNLCHLPVYCRPWAGCAE